MVLPVRHVAEAAVAHDNSFIAELVIGHDPAPVADNDVVTAAAGDCVIALAAKYDQRQRGSGGIDRIVIGTVRIGVIMVVWPLGIQDKGAGRPGSQADGHGVVAQAGVQCRNGIDQIIVFQAGTGHRDGVVTIAAPEGNATGKGSAGCVIGDGCRGDAGDGVS